MYSIIKEFIYEMVKPYNIPKELSDRMLEMSIIDMAIDELSIGIELHPETEKDLESIGIDPKEFIKEFQEKIP